MVKKKDETILNVEKIKAELKAIKEKKKTIDQKIKPKKHPKKETKIKKAEIQQLDKTKTKKKKAKESKEKEKKKTKEAKEKKKTKEAKENEKKKAKEAKEKEERTLEEELEEQLSPQEIEGFQIEKVNMEKLTNKVCVILAEKESTGMVQSELWKKLKLSSRDGSRLALKLERMGTITREKILEKGRWTYKLIIKKTPISTESIVNAPCLTCPVEQKCTLDGEISPRTCQWIEDWVTIEIKKPKMAQ